MCRMSRGRELVCFKGKCKLVFLIESDCENFYAATLVAYQALQCFDFDVESQVYERIVEDLQKRLYEVLTKKRGQRTNHKFGSVGS